MEISALYREIITPNRKKEEERIDTWSFSLLVSSRAIRAFSNASLHVHITLMISMSLPEREREIDREREIGRHIYIY